jgi:hypothetical protein
MFDWIPPGTYWNPTPLWWLRNSWIGIGSVRILQLLHILGWLLVTLLTFFPALFLGVVLPFALWVWTILASFFTFMLGLLFVNPTSIDIGTFLPFMLFFGAWTMWLAWPTFSAFVERIYPIARNLADLLVQIFAMMVQVANACFRIWNAFVPVIGFFIYIMADLTVNVYRDMNLLFGEANITALSDALMEITLQIAEIALNIAESIISITPTLLQIFSGVIGACLTVALEVAPKLFEIVTIAIRVLPFKLGPIADLIVQVVRFVKNTFFLRVLLDVALTAAATAGLASAPAHEYSRADHIFREFGASASRYWTPASASQSSQFYSDVNTWLMENPPGSHSDYYMWKGYQIQPPVDSSSYAGRATLEEERGEAETRETTAERATYSFRPPRSSAAHLPPQWKDNDTASANAGARAHLLRHNLPFTHKTGPLSADPHSHLSADEKDAMLHRHTKVSSSPLTAELHKRLPCQGKLCGGSDATVPHPMHTLSTKHARDTTLLTSLLSTDLRSHRKRLAHAAGLVHTARHTLHRLASKHWRKNGPELRQHVAGAWKHVTGHDTLQGAAEQLLSRHPDPLDSIGTLLPVLSEWGPFSYLLGLQPPEEQAQYYGRWAASRHFFYMDEVDETTQETHQVLYVTVALRNESLIARRQQEQQRLNSANQRDTLQVPIDLINAVNPFFPPGQLFYASIAGVAAAYYAGELIEPVLPVMKLLYKRNCISLPRHPWCVPYVPTQLICIVTQAVHLIPNTLPVQLSDYEEQCKDVGFCFIKRPDIIEGIIIVNQLKLFFNACWFRNFFAWLGVMFGLLLPVTRAGFQVCASIVPIFGPLICQPIANVIPQPISLQQGVCLFIYFYAVMMVIFLVWLAHFLWPLVMWAWNALQGLFAMLQALRTSELALNAGLEAEPWYAPWHEAADYQSQRRLVADGYAGVFVPPHQTAADTVLGANTSIPSAVPGPVAGVGVPTPMAFPDFVDNSNASVSVARQQQAWYYTAPGSPVPLPQQQQSITADIEHSMRSGTAYIPPDAQHHLRRIQSAVREAEQLYGRVSDRTTSHEISNFEARCMPYLVPFHASVTYISQVIEHKRYMREQQRRSPHPAPPLSLTGEERRRRSDGHANWRL